jgi:hypothetical protein
MYTKRYWAVVSLMGMDVVEAIFYVGAWMNIVLVPSTFIVRFRWNPVLDIHT